MLRFLIKALWHLETKESNNGANLFASSFANIFVMLCMRLIGRKSVTRIASTFFGRSIMFAEFNLSKPWEFSENMLLIAAIMSSLIMSQQVLKKAPVNPSGPGTLSDDMENIVSLWRP
jgi:hypothetical protein